MRERRALKCHSILLLFTLAVNGVIYIFYIVEHVGPDPLTHIPVDSDYANSPLMVFYNFSYYFSLLTETIGLPMLLRWTEYMITVLGKGNYL